MPKTVVLKCRRSGKYGLFPSLLGKNCARLVLSIGMVGELRRAGGHRALKNGLLQIVKYRGVLFGQESHGNTTLSSTSRSANTMNIVCQEIWGKSVILGIYQKKFHYIQMRRAAIDDYFIDLSNSLNTFLSKQII